MGLFGNLGSSWRKAKASTLIVNVLNEYKTLNPLFSADIHGSANVFVQNIWDKRPDVFNGKFGQRPHKITTATMALANAVNEIPDESSNKSGVIWALGFFLEEIEINGRLYPFNSLDWQLIEESKELLKIHVQKFYGEE